MDFQWKISWTQMFFLRTSNPKWSIVKSVSMNALVWSGQNNGRLFCQILQAVELQEHLCKHVYSCDNHPGEPYDECKANYLYLQDFGWGGHEALSLVSRSPNFIFGKGHSEVEKKPTCKLPYIIKPSGVLSIFILVVKEGSDKRASIISSEGSS